MRFNEANYAEYYHRQMIDNGYPGKLLPFVEGELDGYSTVLDVGSGTGLFTIPLAEIGHHITAVDPSREMLKILERSISVKLRPFIKISDNPWIEWNGEYHDALISVHSLYPMRDIEESLALMKRSAGKKIVIIRESSAMRTLSGLVRARLDISSNRDLNDEVSGILDRIAAGWKLVNIHEERKHFIHDAGSEAESLVFQLKLDPARTGEVSEIVKNEMVNDGGFNYFKTVYSDNAYIFT